MKANRERQDKKIQNSKEIKHMLLTDILDSDIADESMIRNRDKTNRS